MKTHHQVNFIRSYTYFKPDFWDVALFILMTFSFITADVAIYKVYEQGHLSFPFFLFIESILLLVTIIMPVRYIHTFSFQVIHTQLPFAVNKDRIIAYLRHKGLEIIYSPTDDTILKTHFISFGFISMLKEMTLVCMDGKILMNVRSAYGKDIWNYKKDNRLYKEEIERFLHY